jgi:hypothetical protein
MLGFLTIVLTMFLPIESSVYGAARRLIPSPANTFDFNGGKVTFLEEAITVRGGNVIGYTLGLASDTALPLPDTTETTINTLITAFQAKMKNEAAKLKVPELVAELKQAKLKEFKLYALTRRYITDPNAPTFMPKHDYRGLLHKAWFFDVADSEKTRTASFGIKCYFEQNASLGKIKCDCWYVSGESDLITEGKLVDTVDELMSPNLFKSKVTKAVALLKNKKDSSFEFDIINLRLRQQRALAVVADAKPLAELKV